MGEHRDNAQREADLDLAKKPRKLLYDIHDELLRTDREPEENVLHASKRIASLQVKIAEKNDSLAAAQLAASVKTGELLDALKTYAAASEDRSAKSEKDMRQLNRKMLWLTVAGVVLALAGSFLGGASLWYAHKADQREELKAVKEALQQKPRPSAKATTPAPVPKEASDPTNDGKLPLVELKAAPELPPAPLVKQEPNKGPTFESPPQAPAIPEAKKAGD